MTSLIITETPLLSGYARDVLRASLGDEEYEMISVLGGTENPKKVKPERWLKETERLQEEAKKHDKVLCCGGISAAAWFGSDRTVAITKVRGRGMIEPVSGKYTLCTLNPSVCVADPDFYRDLDFDVEKFTLRDEPIPEPELEVVVIENKDDFHLLEELHSATFLSCDIETTGFNPFSDSILSIGFGALCEDGSGYVVVLPQEVLSDRRIAKFFKTYKGTFVFHNLKFDIQHLWKRYGRFKAHAFADTMLMGWALDERPFNRYRHLGLKLLSRLYFDAPSYDLHMGEWLEEWLRKAPKKSDVHEYLTEFCVKHPEKARSYWREKNPDKPWRGLKVGRDIPVAEVWPCIPLPLGLRPVPSKERKQHMWDEMLQYMAYDCFYTARLYPELRDRIEAECPRGFNLLENTLVPASLALANMEMGGARVNVEYLETMREEIVHILEKEMEEIRALVATQTNLDDPEEFNPNSSQQVARVLYNAGDDGGLGLAMPRGQGRYAYKRDENDVTTNSDTLKILSRQVATKMPAARRLIDLILSYRVKSKILGTYIDGLLDRVDGDERIRGDFNLHGTATGRLSCSKPNLQNIPDASHVGFDIRSAYIPSEGCVILEADYSQLELRVAALFSQDPVLLDAYQGGADIHQEVAFMLWKKPKDEITKYERYLAKCMNFGVLYGRGATSIATGPEMDNLVEMSGRKWSTKEIEDYFAKFKVGYKVLFDWMDLIKGECFREKYVEGPLGNRRRFPLVLKDGRAGAERQIVNSPIQGFAAQMTVRALVELDRLFDPEKQRILFTVHDSIMCECAVDCIEETARLIKDTMENLLPEDAIASFPVLPHAPFQQGEYFDWNLPFVADVALGASWGEAKYDPFNPEDREMHAPREGAIA
jgi:DNA polymerase I-like protein with 3'-5' exonuclease and polymerase domains